MAIQTKLHLGESPPVELAVRDDAWLGSPTPSNGQAVELDVAAAAKRAMEAPLGYPPLNQSIVTGDHVAIALGEGVRAAAQVVRGLVAAIQEAGAPPDSIVILAGDKADAARLEGQLCDLVESGCRIASHDPANEDGLCYVAAMNEQPLLMNRELFEADIVIPVGCARLAQARDYRGPYESVYPRFGDLPTGRKYEQGDSLDTPQQEARRESETDEAGWLLGAMLVVQVVPGSGGGVAAVLAGAAEEVARTATDRCEAIWLRPVRDRASLVVATLAGGPDEQTWANVARALYAAARVADEDMSAVAICTELETPPGEALQRIIAADGDLEDISRIGEHQSPDAQAAWELYKALCRGQVYFMSRLDDSMVEDLGMIPIASRNELARLVQRSASCVVLDEAQHALPVLNGTPHDR